MKKPVISVTMSEASGIGPEVLVKAFADPRVKEICQAVAIGDVRVLEAAAKNSNMDTKFNPIDHISQAKFEAGVIDVFDQKDLSMDDFKLAEPNAKTGLSMLNQTRRSVELFLDKQVDGTVGGPHSKYACEQAGIHFSGYPYYIAEMTNSPHPYLMLSNGKLCVSNVTLHVSLRQALDMLDIDLVYNCIVETEKAIQAFGIEKPRIAVAGLNPHAGESRMFGDEDEDIIKPAIAKALAAGINVVGPIPADSLFNNCLTNNKYDGYVGMYHDQAHLPVKVLVFDESSAVAIGIPVNWATVDHGCALDIAWKNVANPNALVSTMCLVAKRADKFRDCM